MEQVCKGPFSAVSWKKSELHNEPFIAQRDLSAREFQTRDRLFVIPPVAAQAAPRDARERAQT